MKCARIWHESFPKGLYGAHMSFLLSLFLLSELGTGDSEVVNDGIISERTLHPELFLQWSYPYANHEPLKLVNCRQRNAFLLHQTTENLKLVSEASNTSTNEVNVVSQNSTKMDTLHSVLPDWLHCCYFYFFQKRSSQFWIFFPESASKRHMMAWLGMAVCGCCCYIVFVFCFIWGEINNKHCSGLTPHSVLKDHPWWAQGTI